jgi:hypothetical protein
MTTEEIAEHLQASPVGPGRWVTKCPAHDDGSPSLSIREGADGKTLLFCHAGCELCNILSASGLRLRDLFPGPPVSAAQARGAKAARLSREEQARERRIADRAACDRITRLEAVADELVSRLVRASDDDPATNAMARLFHQTLDLIRLAEAEVAR